MTITTPATFDPIQPAFERAANDFRKENLQDPALLASISQITSASQVYDATEKLQAEQARTGHMRHLSKIEPYLSRLGEYADAITVFVQAKPDILALIWGPIVLLLQWANALKTSFDAIVNITAEIGNALPEFQQAMKVFEGSEKIKDVLLLFFRDILDFYKVALRFFRLPRWRFVFEAIWPKHRDKIKVVATHIERHTLFMRKNVQFEHIQQEHEARVRALEHFEITEKAQRRQEYYNIRTDVAPQTYDEKLSSLRDRICEGTGKWLLKDSVYRKWADASDKSVRLLWLNGIPGAGKTYLSGIVVSESQTRGKTLFAFLSYNSTRRISSLSVIHSLIFQLASEDVDLQTVMCELSRENLKNNSKVALDMMRTLLTCVGPVSIVVDGLDEIEETERGQLVQRMLYILKECENVTVLLSSRIEADLKAVLSKEAKAIKVDERNTDSIQAFVEQWMERWVQTHGITESGRIEVGRWLDPLASKSKGMFLYARVVLSSVEYLDDMDEIEGQLKALPENLDEAYARILSRIDGLPSAQRDKARKLLGWIACAPILLTERELQHALAIKSNDLEGKVRLIADIQIERLCGPIIEVTSDGVQLVHFTVQEYLCNPSVMKHIDYQESSLSLTLACLTYLCQRHHDPQLDEEEIRKNIRAGAYVLHGFAITSWLELVERSINRCASHTLPPELIQRLEQLHEERANPEYENESGQQMETGLSRILQKWPETRELLSKDLKFRHFCSTSQCQIEDSTWTERDPLTLAKTSVSIQEQTDLLLDCDSSDNHASCACRQLRKYSSGRPFNCRYIHCHLRHRGFETNSARKAHEEDHDRPWKCSVPTCEYANGGFLSRKMRDEHLNRGHKAQESRPKLPPLTSQGETASLFADLIQAENFEAAISLSESSNLAYLLETFEQICRPIVVSGTLDQLERLTSSSRRKLHGKKEWIALAIDNDMPEKLDYLFCLIISWGYTSHLRVLDKIVKSDSMAMLEIWKKHMKLRIIEYKEKSGKTRSDDPFHLLTSFPSIEPRHQQVVIRIWEDLDIINNLPASLNFALHDIAAGCCSVKLAKFWIDAGVSVDHRNHSSYLTPLHHAARKDTAQAADLLRFLLQCGANPEGATIEGKNGIRSHKKHPKDEKGAKGIEKWLGITWDQLVEETEGVRQEQRMKERMKAEEVKRQADETFDTQLSSATQRHELTMQQLHEQQRLQYQQQHPFDSLQEENVGVGPTINERTRQQLNAAAAKCFENLRLQAILEYGRNIPPEVLASLRTQASNNAKHMYATHQRKVLAQQDQHQQALLNQTHQNDEIDSTPSDQ